MLNAGFRLLRLARSSDLALSGERAAAPRPGYNPGESIDRVICCL
jgi:hypothetical protein